MTHPTLTLPDLPLSLPEPINVELNAHDACWPSPPVPWWRRFGPWSDNPAPALKRVNIGCSAIADGCEADDVDQWLAEAKMRAELSELEDRPRYDDEVQFEAPTLLQPTSGLSAESRATLQGLVDHRRIAAQSRTVLILPNKPNPSLSQADPGYTLVHHATGVMASFYLEASGYGTVLAKSYSNPLLDTSLLPKDMREAMPNHFYGYGIGRRLYLAAHELWPHIRWQDHAVRSTSHALRSRLHSTDPYTWHDKNCPTCAATWHRATSPEDLRALH